MYFSATTYQLNNLTINKTYVLNGWVMVYNDLLKIVISHPTHQEKTFVETIHTICVKQTKEELIETAHNLKLSNLHINEFEK